MLCNLRWIILCIFIVWSTNDIVGCQSAFLVTKFWKIYNLQCIFNILLLVSFPLGQRQNTALPNRGGVHLPVRPRHPLAELQASLHVVRNAQGWWPWMASPSQVSPAHLNCRFSMFVELGNACSVVFDLSVTALMRTVKCHCMSNDKLSLFVECIKAV